ncbi:MAG TPA: hypothetical protein VGX50_15635 [Longimicrobium sp.]|jgi:hypothetical protein|nr:hypothetical protein [Longimicrobium sp.]
MAAKDIRTIKRKYSSELMDREGVEGLGIERDEAGSEILVLHISTSDPDVLASLPRELDGHPVHIVQSGVYRRLG